MRRKVLYVYYEPQASGQTTHVLSLVRGLNAEKYAITVVLPDHLHQSRTAFQQSGATTISLKMGKLWWNPSSIARLITLIRQQKFDIVHVHSQEAGVLARPFARLAGARNIIYTPQCTNIRRANWFWMYRSLEKLLSSTTYMIVSVSKADRERIVQWGIPASKVTTIYNGIHPEGIEDSTGIMEMKRMLNLDDQQLVVMQVGRLSYQKNPLFFVKGASLVLNKYPDARFLLVGDGPLRGAVEEYIQGLGITDQVRCLGWQDNANQLMGAADIITLTSRWEGLPYVLLEAMAWALPVVSTGVNGCPEIVEHGVTGYLVSGNDVNSWAKALIELLGDPPRSRAMGQRGRQRLAENFSLERMIKHTEGLYDRLAPG